MSLCSHLSHNNHSRWRKDAGDLGFVVLDKWLILAMPGLYGGAATSFGRWSPALITFSHNTIN